MRTFEQIAELERRYLLGTYNRYPVAFARGKGVFVYDLEDRRYLDFGKDRAVMKREKRTRKRMAKREDKIEIACDNYNPGCKGSFYKNQPVCSGSAKHPATPEIIDELKVIEVDKVMKKARK